MKAILEFNLDDFDDAMAHRRCIKALDLTFVLWDLLNKEELTQKGRKMVLDKMAEHNVNLDELII